jgi:hypothetical protein
VAKKKATKPAQFFGTGEAARKIIKCLEKASSASGQRPSVIFADWTEIVEATLQAMPEQVKAIGSSGAFAADPPEIQELFRRVRSHYEDPLYPSAHRLVWQNFGQAFSLLLESSSKQGLWSFDFDDGYMGPDILGHTYMVYANSDPGWQGQFFTPWNIALLMARMTIPDGQREVYDRIKAALLHPDNILGHSVLLASVMIEDNAQAWDWFMTRVIPAALPYYEPILFQEPAIGSGVMMLAAAACYPAWAVQLNLVRFFGQDLDPLCVRMAKINGYLYGLNGLR